MSTAESARGQDALLEALELATGKEVEALVSKRFKDIVYEVIE